MTRKRPRGPVTLDDMDPRIQRLVADELDKALRAAGLPGLGMTPAPVSDRREKRFYACGHACPPESDDWHFCLPAKVHKDGNVDCRPCRLRYEKPPPGVLEIYVVDTGRVLRFAIPPRDAQLRRDRLKRAGRRRRSSFARA